MADPNASARIVTFYSYKGGTGRSMALANVAWILAANGKRVAVIDWDLEAPGLHRYFHPYLHDPELVDSTGVIDFVMTYAREAIKPAKRATDKSKSWYLPFANLLRHASSLDYDFPDSGTIDFIPSGRQGPDYAARVNSFNWSSFYEKQQGGLFLEAAKQSLAHYDYVLIDSRTGVSDTSGICTVQLPHVLVVCFTPNAQSIDGASAIARSADQQRTRADGTRTLTILPVMTRVLTAEKERVEAAKRKARDRFDGLLWQFDGEREKERYWGRMSAPQEPFYAFEEVLAVFGDESGSANTMLAAMETLAGYITSVSQTAGPEPVLRLPKLDDAARRVELGKFVRFELPRPEPKPVPTLAVPRKTAMRSARPEQQRESGEASDLWFYLSYARSDADVYLERFHSDLAHRVTELTGQTLSTAVSFFDRNLIDRGRNWYERIAQPLTRARTLVAIVSPNFVVSEFCGKEWQLFVERAQRDGRAASILPVMWAPPRFIENVPSVISRIMWWNENFPERYREEGLRRLISLGGRRSQYREFIDSFAERLMELAADAPAPTVGTIPPFETVANAFAGEERLVPSRSEDIVRFVVMAGTSAEMDRIRNNGAGYGKYAEDWAPYQRTPVALVAENAAAKYGASVEAYAAPDGLEQLVKSDQSFIVIVDVWALKLQRVSQMLSDLGRYYAETWSYILVFDEEQDTHENSEELRAAGNETLRNTYNIGLRKIQEVHSEPELIQALGSAITTLQLELISRARPVRPDPPDPPLPLIDGPELKQP